MNLRDLEYFIAIVETGRFHAAAERCHVSQPTLSGQIRKLEEELGHELFDRTTRTVSLTSFGREALPFAYSIQKSLQGLERKAEERKNPFSGPLVLGAFPTLAPWLLPRLSPWLAQWYPKVEFYLSEEKTPVLLDNLIKRELDAAFLALPIQAESALEVLPLFREDFLLALATSHPWAERSEVTTDEFAGLNLLLLGDGHCLRDQALDLCSRFGAHEKPYFMASSLETLRQMVRLGTGITLVPRLAVPNYVDDGIRYIPIRGEEVCRHIGLCFRPSHPRREFFLDLARQLRSLCGNELLVSPEGA